MANIKDLIQSIESGDSSFDEKLAAINAMEETLVAMRAQEQEAIDDNVSLIVEAIRVMERKVEAQLEVARAIVPEKGEPGRDGKDGPAGRDGLSGRDGQNGQNGKDGQDGEDGVSVTDAKIDFDGSLVITLSTGREINVGEVVAPDLAEKIKVISTMSTNTAIADITGGTIDGAVIGSTTPAAGTFTTLTSTGEALLGANGSNYQTFRATAGTGAFPWVQTSHASGDARIRAAADSGAVPLSVSSLGSQAVRFYTDAFTNLQLNVSRTASAVNYVQVTGAATTLFPNISAQGSDSNIGLTFASKGSQAIRFNTNTSDQQFRITHTGSAVNYIQVTGNIAGSSPRVLAEGSDTNIDLALTPKGTGKVRFGTFTADMTLIVQGYIEIKDSGGTVRKLAVIA
jgi:hypothetical protein